MWTFYYIDLKTVPDKRRFPRLESQNKPSLAETWLIWYKINPPMVKPFQLTYLAKGGVVATPPPPPLEILTIACLTFCLLTDRPTLGLPEYKLNVVNICKMHGTGPGLEVVVLKSVQSTLGDLLTTSATHGTFSRPSTKRGLTLIGLELNTNARESLLIISSESVNRSTCLSVYLIITRLRNVNLLFFRQYRGYRFS